MWSRDTEMALESSKADPLCRWRKENVLARGRKIQGLWNQKKKKGFGSIFCYILSEES